MDYTSFSVTDFLSDPSFQRWVAGTDEATNQFWENYLIQHPEQTETLREAAHLARLLVFQEHPLPEGRAEEMLAQIQDRLQSPVIPIGRTVTEAAPTHPSHDWFRYGQRVAAILVGTLLLVAFWLYLLPGSNLAGEQAEVRYTTAFGETRNIVLPDQSTAVLNANSSLVYVSDGAPGGSREVWVKGEAFFEVVHTQDHRKFIVHADSLEVEVLGTQFSVDNRRGGGAVVLTEGQVKVQDVRQTQQLVMAPGERVVFSSAQEPLTREQVDPARYASWRHRQLTFARTPLREVAQTIQDTYGLTVVFADTALHARTFTGTTPTDDLDALLASLAVTFDLQQRREGTRILYQAKP